ncbi:hypothetical protein BC827DRAFT_70014 [Russula dissimulans]|nr:hypothetical protein BC827DRAFT_70014 [Russula dissimulans]
MRRDLCQFVLNLFVDVSLIPGRHHQRLHCHHHHQHLHCRHHHNRHRSPSLPRHHGLHLQYGHFRFQLPLSPPLPQSLSCGRRHLPLRSRARRVRAHAVFHATYAMAEMPHEHIMVYKFASAETIIVLRATDFVAGRSRKVNAYLSGDSTNPIFGRVKPATYFLDPYEVRTSTSMRSYRSKSRKGAWTSKTFIRNSFSFIPSIIGSQYRRLGASYCSTSDSRPNFLHHDSPCQSMEP